jgi:Flp pilus assembly pilin Flp
VSDIVRYRKPEENRRFMRTFVQLQCWRQRCRQLLAATDGQDLIEYALLAAFIAVAAGAIFPTTIAPSVSMMFSKAKSTMDTI